MITDQNLGAFIVTIVCLPFVILFLVLILSQLRTVRKAGASKRWPMTDGRIVSSDVTSHRSLDNDGMHTTIYEPAVVYEYNVNGHLYHGQQVDFGAIDGTSSPDWAENISAKYPVGTSLPVYYNPAKPAEAVLEHSGKATGSLVLIGLFIGLEVLMVGLIVFGLTGHFDTPAF